MMRYLYVIALIFILAANSAFAAFTDNGDGTITDSTTGLTWKKCLEGLSGAACTTGTATTYTWSQALALTVGGWRLPNIKELQSVVDETKATVVDPNNPDPNGLENPAIDTAYFPTPAKTHVYVWSSTPYTGDDPPTKAWLIDFNKGIFMYQFPQNTSGFVNVRLVIDPQ